MEEICPKNQCTACAACMNICPKNAICMVEKGPLGYDYPQIDPSLCIDCGLCQKICPSIHPVTLNKPLKAYAATARDNLEYMSSASGGAASVFARAILSEGGVVYGCELENWHSIGHRRYTDIQSVERMKGSKYVQSRIGMVFSQVRKDLEQGVTVLFTGTPCQVAGLRSYLRKSYDNLYCVDLVCHGVPSQKLLRDNVESMCQIYNCTPHTETKLSFRKKSQTSEFFLRYGVFLQEHAIPERAKLFPYNDYITAFMSGLIFRKNCFQCPYAGSSRAGDVTVADYWGLADECRIPRPAGVSLLLPSTKQGEQLIARVSSQFYIEQRPVSEAIRGNGQLQKSSKEPENRDAFILDYSRIGQQAYSRHLTQYRKSYRRTERKKAVFALLRKIPGLYPLYRSLKNKTKDRK